MKQIIYTCLMACLITQKIAAQAPIVEWAKQSRSNSNEKPLGIAFDASGNIYYTGYYSGYTDFDPGPLTFQLNPGGSQDVFVSKLDSMGNFVWAIGIKGQGQLGSGVAKAIKLDKAGNIYIVGEFDDTFDFDPSASSFTLHSPFTVSDIFIAKYDSSGNFIWAEKFGNSLENETVYDLAIDGNANIYLTGKFQSIVDFDPSIAVSALSASGTSYDTYISKLDSSGNFIWAQRVGGTVATSFTALAIDSSANLYATGYFKGVTDFDPDTASTANLTSSGATNEDFLIAKYDSAGNYIWAKQVGGTGQDFANDIALDSAQNIIIAGRFRGTVDFNPGVGVFNMTSINPIEPSMCVLKLDNQGNFIWAKNIGGNFNSNINSIALDAEGKVYATGYYFDTNDFDPGASVYNLSPFATSLYSDAFVFKLNTAGDFVWAMSLGGDKSEQANVIEFNHDNKPYIGGTFSSAQCHLGNFTLPNTDPLSQSIEFFMLRLGTINTGLETNLADANFSVFPNPATDYITINTTENVKSKKPVFELVDAMGKQVIAMMMNDISYKVDVKNLSPGIYFYHLHSNDGSIAKGKVILE